MPCALLGRAWDGTLVFASPYGRWDVDQAILRKLSVMLRQMC